MTTTIHDVLDEIRAVATDERDKGDKFEQLIAAFLRTDAQWVNRFDGVWTWMDWEGRDGKGDTGIDLVARERDTGDWCAIQCKFYDVSHTLSKGDIDSFFTASGKAPFSTRLIVSTTDNWGKNAEDALEHQQIPVSRLRVQDLDDSSVDWSTFRISALRDLARRTGKQIRPHQRDAIDDVLDGLATRDRGKLIMACGTGKTYTSLNIVQELVPAGGTVLFLVPSISLLSQTLKEWSNDATVPLRPFAVCSDARAGRRTASEDIGPYDLAFPASTDTAKLVARVQARPDPDAITVIFSTYQSIDVVAQAQAQGLGEFDLIVCDEAHRTTGVTLADEDESHFVKVHDNSFITATKRLYMTATPRIYDEASKTKAAENTAVVASMDDEAVYGPELHRLGFGEAVSKDLLTDYKVLVLAVDEEQVSKTFQSQLADEDSELKLDDAARIVGCWNGLAKRGKAEFDFSADPAPMTRAVAFARSIKDSKRFADLFEDIIRQYVDTTVDEEAGDVLMCKAEHVDGTYNVLKRNERLDWLKEQTEPNNCRVLSNARCLSEGVDVPALDAVMFLNPRNSIVDVVQSVGRVMRKAEGKNYGYVILPIGVPAGMTAEQALADNKKYKVVWQVLQALRAHDERFDATVNKIELNKTATDKINVIAVPPFGDQDSDRDGSSTPKATQGTLHFPDVGEWREAIYAKIVQKVGSRRYWEQWAGDVAEIAEKHTARIRALLDDPTQDVAAQFEAFLEGLRGNLNDSITRDDAIDMLAQHLITRPVFEALFEGYSFAEHNPVSQVMEGMLAALDEHSLDKENESLEKFYASVRLRAEGIDNAEGKQRIITELYEKFFKIAFPRTAESLGIVYTPVEIVDFIIRSVEHVLNEEFGASISDEGVHVLDPFTGTGTFIVRLLQSGLIKPEDLLRKYTSELHTNEILLLAYYIAAVNIEATMHALAGGQYRPFNGIVLTDTFQMTEDGDAMDEVIFPQNNERVAAQKALDIRVVIGNPPYSVGQGSQNDGNQNMSYATLDKSIERTYAARSGAGLKRNLYDSYIRAFRWASNRIADNGIVCFVSNGSFIDSGSADGFRKVLLDEFTSVYCFNLRGNQRTSGETSRKEGGKIFGGGSRTPVAITLLVRNPAKARANTLSYRDIGDYLSREDKLRIIAETGDASGVPWELITANAAGDWINQRDDRFATFTPLGDKKGGQDALFDTYSIGVVTNRDAWAYNFSEASLLANITRMAEFYEEQRAGLGPWLDAHGLARTDEATDKYIDRDPKKISWTRGLKSDLRKDKTVAVPEPSKIVASMYRPFCKQRLYFDRQLNEMVLQQPRLFPTREHANRVIAVTGSGVATGFSALMTDAVPNLHLEDTGQTFPLYRYEPVDEGDGLFVAQDAVDGYVRHDAISDHALTTYRSWYGSELAKEDIFYLVYGLLHSPDYQTRYAADLKKLIPRIPRVSDFWGFSRIGRELGHLHVGYEAAEIHPLDGMPGADASPADMRVEKMTFGKTGKATDRSVIRFNSTITLSGIPEAAYGYQVNGKSAIEWIMDRYQVKTDKDSGIVNDPNDWGAEAGYPRYVVELLARMVTVSLESVRLVGELPPLKIVD